MAEIIIPDPTRYFAGFIYQNDDLLTKSVYYMQRKYGCIDCVAGPFDFKHTDYYKESGSSLKKFFISFENKYMRDEIITMKRFSNEIEDKFALNGVRQVNIDPGYITKSNVFLASCKDYYHRMYLGKGIFLENELRYTDRKYTFFDWTYPDYKSDEYLSFFYELRRKL